MTEKAITARIESQMNREFAAIAIPALAQFAAEPIAGLVDTAYLGRLGSAALGGAGVAISAHYSCAKLFNDPLLRSSISIVASGDGATRTKGEAGDSDQREQAISAALLLAFAVGLYAGSFALSPHNPSPLARHRPVTPCHADTLTRAGSRPSSFSPSRPL